MRRAKILSGKRIRIKVIIKTFINGRSDGAFRIGEKTLYGLGYNM